VSLTKESFESENWRLTEKRRRGMMLLCLGRQMKSLKARDFKAIFEN
jgi:hypothetical protein